MVINDNSDIYSSCKCGSQFHKFFRKVTTDTEDAFDAEKSQLKSKRKKHKRKKRFSFNAVNTPTIQTPICQPCNTAESTSSSSSEESFYLTTTQPYTQTSQKPNGNSILITPLHLRYDISDISYRWPKNQRQRYYRRSPCK